MKEEGEEETEDTALFLGKAISLPVDVTYWLPGAPNEEACSSFPLI